MLLAVNNQLRACLCNIAALCQLTDLASWQSEFVVKYFTANMLQSPLLYLNVWGDSVPTAIKSKLLRRVSNSIFACRLQEAGSLVLVMKLILLTDAILLLLLQPASAKESSFSGQVMAIVDGDTIKVLHDGLPETIRLSGIDCPEKRQAFRSAARKFTSDFCFGKQVVVSWRSHDRYGRTIGDVELTDGRDLNQAPVAARYAWWYQKYAADDTELLRLESAARSRRSRLWSDPDPLSPWDFPQQRRNHAE